MCNGTSECGSSTAPGSGKIGKCANARSIRAWSSMAMETNKLKSFRLQTCSLGGFLCHALALRRMNSYLDAHAVEAAPDEHDGNGEEDRRQHQPRPGLHLGGQFDGQEAEEGGELDDGVHRHRRSVLEGVAYGIAHHG